MKQIEYNNRTLFQKILFWVAMIGQLLFPLSITLGSFWIVETKDIKPTDWMIVLCAICVLLSMAICIVYLFNTDKNYENFHTFSGE